MRYVSYVNKVWHGSCNKEKLLILELCKQLLAHFLQGVLILNYVNNYWHGSCIEDFNKLHKNFNKFHKMDFSKIGLEAMLRLG